MRKVVAVMLTAFSLGACVTWPQHGYGGAAEHEQVRGDNTKDRARLIAAQTELAMVRELDGSNHVPAALNVAVLQWKRAARALKGGFQQAAQGDLTRLEAMLADIRSRLRIKLTVSAEQVAAKGDEVEP